MFTPKSNKSQAQQIAHLKQQLVLANQEIERLKKENERLKKHGTTTKSTKKPPSSYPDLMFKASSSGASSSRLSQSSPNQPLTALKSNHELSEEQMDLQDQLTQACYNCDIEKVKELVEIQETDPAIPDRTGQQPLAAAICGLSLCVMDYLESKIGYTQADWSSIVNSAVEREDFAPSRIASVKTYEEWLDHYNSGLDKWVYTSNDLPSDPRTDRVNFDSTTPLFLLEGLKKNRGWGKKLPDITDFTRASGLCKTMADRLRAKGVEIKDDFKLEEPVSPNPL